MTYYIDENSQFYKTINIDGITYFNSWPYNVLVGFYDNNKIHFFDHLQLEPVLIKEYQLTYLSFKDTKIIDSLVKFHDGQFRKESKIPYISHPFDVMNLLVKCNVGNIDILLASLYHDVIEDCFQSNLEKYYNLIDIIGIVATDLVVELTFDKTICTKEEYIKSFICKSPEALLIKIADRICNVRDFMTNNLKYAKKYFKKAEFLFNLFFRMKKQFDPIVYNKLKYQIVKLQEELKNE
jgi:hypothetical protein